MSSVVIRIGAETAQAVGAIRNVDKALGDTQTSGQKLQAGIQRAAVPAAIAFTALSAAAVSSAKAAAEDAASREKLEGQIRRSTGATDAAISANNAYIDSMMRQTAIADDELRPAMAQLVRASGDVHESQKLLALSADLAAATGKPLATVTAAVAKGYAGNAAGLKKLVPGLSDAAVKSKDWAKVQAELNAQVGGAAAESAETASGQYRLMTIEMGELQESIGAGLLPILQAVLPVFTRFAGIAGQHPGAILAVAGAVAAVAAAILAANAAIRVYTTAMTIYNARTKIVAAATRVWAAAQWLLNAAMSANPIALAIIAVAALTAGIVIAYRHSSRFREIVQSAFATAKQNAVLLLGPIGLLIRAFQLLYEKSGTVRAAVKGAMDAITAAIEAVLDAVNRLIGALGRIHVPSIDLPGPLALPGGASSGPASRSAGGGPVINVSISGAIDPESTALAIRRVMERYDRRRGQRPLGG